MTQLAPPPASVPTPGGYGPVVNGRVMTSAGYEIDADTARRAAEATPHNTERGRRSRAEGFVAWCRERGRLHTDPGALPDYVNHLARLRHPVETIETYATTLSSQLALQGHPLAEQDRYLVRAVIASRAAEIATDPHETGDALQSTACSRADLRALVDTLDRGTVRGKRDALALLLDWHMAGRSCEPGSLALPDVREETAHVESVDGGPGLELPALRIVFRRSKTNPHGRRTDVVRIVMQTDADADICPVRAYREWMEVLARHGVAHSGPLLRRIDRHGRIGGTGRCAGRQPADTRQAGGIGARTVRNIINKCARLARLVPALTAEESELLSTSAERAELNRAATDAEREAVRADRRIRRRALRRRQPRYTGHSMRRGLIQHLEKLGIARHVIERHCRFVPGSKALSRYGLDLLPWAHNPTVVMRR
ncbi:hypothetical protein ACIQU6_30625 [Streptomyces sp. NPDC090442]|uniref:hypothetical protein n=1 Tax=Streptomyces sp. NPDC090442 TaxID=3365962 RepID=UPI00380687E3